MPATPAWPPSSPPRLYVGQVLAQDSQIELEGTQAHYLGTVLRLKEGAEVKLFDNQTGEWLSQITQVRKKHVTLHVTRHLRERESVPDLWLLFAPIKRGRIDWIVEKATELGASRLLPIFTKRTIVERINLDRLRANVIEAAEQCGRTTLPELLAPYKLENLLRDWPKDRALIFADEQGGDTLLKTVVHGPAAILIGPEGGFAAEERAMIRALPASIPVTLGPRILRAETAVVAAISLWMASAGDWDEASGE